MYVMSSLFTSGVSSMSGKAGKNKDGSAGLVEFWWEGEPSVSGAPFSRDFPSRPFCRAKYNGHVRR